MFRITASGVVVCALGALGGCAGMGAQQADESAHKAHDAYVAAINSNDLETFLGMLTEDVVFMAPNSPRIVGKDAVRAWAAPYLEAYEVHWEKTTLELVVAGDWAIEQYAYVENDTPRGDWPALTDTGKGINIYRREADGVWRVARDAWNSDLPAPAPEDGAAEGASLSNVELIRGVYDAFAAGDVPGVLGAMSAQIVWNEAENFPYADGNPYVGPEAVLSGVFARCIGEWDGFGVEIDEILDAGDTVVATGRYVGTYKATGQAQNTQLVHVWRIEDGRITGFQQYADTLQVARVMGQGG
ncbi:MAG: nuclear transport factor 2 family protein [Phycisphaerales bacterium JB039]